MHTYSIQIKGMTCGGCASSVQRKLEALPEISQCEVNFATESARIGSAQILHPKQIIDWVRSFGFSVQTEHKVFRASDDQFDEIRLVSLLEEEANVVSFQLNPQLRSIDFTTLPEANTQALKKALEAHGFTEIDAPDNITSTGESNNHGGVWIAALLSSPLVIQMIGMWLGSNKHLPIAFEWALATPIQFWLGFRFYRGALAALRRGEANMDTLVVLGTTVAYSYSLYQWMSLGSGAIGHLYFEASAVVITLVLVGKNIENRAKQSALESVSVLYSLRPKRVTCLRQGKEATLDFNEISSGDVLIIRAGERIGADGIVIVGEADIDASAVTGESTPEHKSTGDYVISGTLVVNGTIRVSAERVGDASTVSQVAELVKNAQMGKAPVQRLVDRVSRIFVPTVLILATVTFAGWLALGQAMEYAVAAAISVLVIACPCALGLATPTALVAGTGLLAKKGILVKDIQTLEALPEVEVVAFDKTGTLTKGEPIVIHTEAKNTDLEIFINRLVQVARESTHPLAQAIIRDLDRPSIPITAGDDAVTLPGQGISVMIGEANYKLGQPSFVTDDTSAVSVSSQSTCSYLSKDGQLLGYVKFSDATREEAHAVIDALKENGNTTVMLSGDQEHVAKMLSAELRIDAFHSGLSPSQKIEIIESYQSKGQKIAMVGDGINDGPALAKADVGIAMGSGSEIALQSAHIVLMRADLRLIPTAIHYARKSRKVIRQNLGWAFGYNLLCIPLAMSGLLSPAIAGAAMALSSVSVVVNAMRLKYSG